MRQVGKIADRDEARRFTDFLLTRGIKTQTDTEADGVLVWAFDEDRIAEARGELQKFLQNPDDERYRAADREAEELRAEAARREREHARKVVDLRTSWRRPVASRGRLTVFLLVASIFVGLATNFGQDRDPIITQYLSIASYRQVGNMIEWHALTEIQSGQVWRLVTPIFIHFGPLHLLFNMLLFYQLGTLVELRRGTRHLLGLIVTIAVVSNLAQYYHGGPSFGGMSGVVYGLFGYIWMKSRFDPAAGMFLAPNFVLIALVWLVLGMTGRIGPIANAAHIGGLLCGVVLGYAPLFWRRLRRGM